MIQTPSTERVATAFAAEPATDRKHTVLFVDDEPNVLDGLRRSTRRLRASWNIHFADSGDAALALVAELPHVDVVVSDMRMPGIDGAELLMRIRDISPATCRVILSGQSDHEAVFRAIGPAHQYLAKPCDVDRLIEVVDRLNTPPCAEFDEPVRTLLGQIDRLPSQPRVFQRLTRELEASNCSTVTVAAIVADDVALTAELLRVVNSSFFGLHGNVESVETAVSLLGMDIVRGVVLAANLFDPAGTAINWLDLAKVGRRSRGIANAARGLALRHGAPHDVAGAAFLIGMVSEVGLLVAGRLPDIDADTADRVNNGVDLTLERATFGADRFCIGSRLLGLWGFDAPIVEAVAMLATPTVAANRPGWYVRATRRLVVEAGIEPDQIADPTARIPELDAALHRTSGSWSAT